MSYLYESDILTPEIQKIIETKVSTNLADVQQEKVFVALKLLLNGDYEKYTFNTNLLKSTLFSDFSNNEEFHSLLSKINEKQNGRQETGRFYTPKDVTEYVVANSFLNILKSTQSTIFSTSNCIEEIKKCHSINDLIFSYSVFDPTCGAGEFLVTALDIKLSLLENPTDRDYLEVIKTIHGNDLNMTSVEITKIRLFFTILSRISDYEYLNELSTILNNNFHNKDFIDNGLFSQSSFVKYNIIVGNPPYVEDGKTTTKPLVSYGNIYANVLENSSNLLSKKGVMGFVLPLSYVSTLRMRKIREVVSKKTPKQILLNYADRPDCLFTGVHQKLTILICSNLTENPITYTSGYNYWYKNERKELLSDKKLVLNKHQNLTYIPKLENEIEESIFSKILATKNDNTFSSLDNEQLSENIYLNMRATFWIKAFSFNPGSKEYKAFHFDKEIQPYILSLLNSNLFFFFWVAVSDCWHITNKELSSFKVILDNVDFEKFQILMNQLEKKLGKTKLFIGTKQTEYAYKHKFCKAEIDLIDTELSKIYSFTKEETDYLKNYKLKYRMGDK